MKRKIKIFLLSLLFVFSTAIISACGESQVQVAFKVGGPYSMTINQEVSLQELVEVSDGEIGDVVFCSSNEDILYITPSQTIIARSEGEAILTVKDSEATLTIVVSGLSLQFDAPTNLSYNETLNRIVWNAMYLENIVANTYTLQISKDGSDYVEYQTNKNYFIIEGNGEYKVKVACNERNGIRASGYSEEYLFTKLTAPTNLKYNDSTKILTWDADNSITSFYVKVNGVLSEKIEGRQYSLSLINEETYEISVMSCAENEENVFGSTCLNPLTLTRLKAVEIKTTSGVVTWEDIHSDAIRYRVDVYNSNNLNSSIQTDYIEKNSIGKYTYTYALDKISDVNSTYSIKVVALGDVDETLNVFDCNSHYLNSAVSQYDGIRKLAKATITFNKETQTVSIFNFDNESNCKYNLYVKYNQEQAQIYDISEGSKVLDFYGVGVYEIYVVNCAIDEKTELNSENSNIIKVIKLDTAKGVEQQVNLENKYVVNNIFVENATSYLLQSTHSDTQETTTLVDYSNGIYGDVDKIFDKAGAYQVKIIALGTDDVDNEIYYINSETIINVHRLQDVSLADDGSKIYWSKDDSFVNVVYVYKLLGEQELEVKTLDTEFIYSNMDKVGEYTLEVFETTNYVEGQSTLILDSLHKSSQTFKITRTIEAPVVTLIKENDQYFLYIPTTITADTYSISCNNNLFEVIENPQEDIIKLCISDCFNTVGNGENLQEYSFKVVLTNVANNYYQESLPTVINVKRASVPTSFTLDPNEKIIVHSDEEWIDGSMVIVDGVESNSLTESKSIYQVQIKLVAKTGLINGIYYLDSDFVEFTLNRDDSEIEVFNNTIFWETTENSKDLSKILTITQGEKTAEIKFNNNENEISINSLKQKITSFVFDYNVNFSATINYSLGEKTFTLNGEYVDGVYESSDDNSYYISSNFSKVDIKCPTEELGINISESNGDVIISWNSSLNDKFILYNNNEKSEVITNNNYTLKREDITVNNITLEQFADIKVVYIFTITKLENISNVTINNDEQLSAKQIENGNVVFLLNGEEITTVTNIEYSEKTITAYYKAKEVESVSRQFYINGDSQTYKFIRLTPTEIIFENNILNWLPNESESEASYDYILTFFDDDELTEDKVVKLNSSVNSIDLNDNKYQQIIHSLNNNKKVVINKVINLFNSNGTYKLDSNKINYLTSKPSEAGQIKVLNTPINVKISSADDVKSQNVIKVQWEIAELESTTINVYNIKIRNGNSETVITTTTNAKEYEFTAEDSFFKSVGEWTVSVQAVGTNGSLNSEYSEQATITRMAYSNLLNINADGLITWSKNDYASNYILEFSYTTALGINEKQYITTDNSITSYQLPQELLLEEFSGEIKATIYTIGDGTNYLSNSKSSKFERLIKPQLVFAEDYMVVTNYDSYVDGTQINITVSIDNSEVIKVSVNPVKIEDGRYVWYYPIEQFVANKDIKIDVFATKTSQNYVNSNIISGIVVMLETISNLRVIKENGVTYFLADNANSVDSYIIDFAGKEIAGSGAEIEIEINDEVLKNIPANWTITAKAIGTVADKTYISSAVVKLTGTKLGVVSGIKTVNGEITWNEMSNASAFKMKIDGEELDKIYLPNLRQEKLEGCLPNSYNIQIRALGNVGEIAISTNIILDSVYSENVTISKLNEIQNININKGFFTFDLVDNATNYIAYVYKYSESGETFIGEYNLTEAKLPVEDSIVYYSGNLTINVIDKTPLIAGEEIRVKFYAKTTMENFIYSDYSKISVAGIEDDYLILKAVNNANNKLTISHPNLLGKEELDYSLTYVNWEHNNDVADSDYLISINSERQIINNGTTELLLDADGSWIGGQTYEIKYKQLGSNVINNDRTVYLTPAFSESIVVKKLETVKVDILLKTSSPYGSYVMFDKIENADKYYCYLNGELYAEHNSVVSEMNLSNLSAGLYENFYVKAISTKQDGDVTYIASNNGLPYYNTVAINKFKKLNAPQPVEVINGAMCWTISTPDLMKIIMNGSIDSPVYVNRDLIEDQQIEILFTASNGAQYKFVDELYKYIYLTDEQIEMIEQYKSFIGEDLYNKIVENRQYGYPSLDYYYTEFGANIPAGEYSIQMKLVGENEVKDGETVTMLFSSDYSEKNVKYITAAPIIIAENKQQNKDDIVGNYYITLSNVQVDGSYFKEEKPKYNLVGLYIDDDGNEVSEIISSITATEINNSEEIAFDITDLINNGIITAKHTQLFVYVEGNDNNLLNGRPSNKINIVVLNSVETRVQHGVIKWNSQDLATKYIIDYGTGIKIINLDEMKTEDSLTYFEWLGEELNAENSNGYNVSITAFGSPLNTESKREIVISGPKTQIGVVIKLPMITTEINGLNIEKGLYTWNKVNNASGYDVFISNENVIPKEFSTIYAKDFTDVISYETTTTKIDEEIIAYYYYFRTVGTENERLTMDSITYVNSNITEYNSGKRLEGVSELKMLNGLISWNPTDNQNLFKLTFNKIEDSSNYGEDIVVYLTYDEVKTSTGSCVFDTNIDERLIEYGNYVVKIQSYRTGKVLSLGESIETYYLISEPEQLEFYKLRDVKDIKVTGGIISWEYADIDNVNAEHYYKLVFANTENLITTTISKFVNIEQFSDIVFDDETMANKPLSLKIFVIPGEMDSESTINFAVSKPTSYESIYQYETIDEETISVTVTDAGQIKIDWAGPDDKAGYDPTVDENVKYQIYYYKKGSIQSAQTYDVENRSYVLCGYGDGADISFDISADSSIVFKIRRIPVKDNYISSAWTVEKEISQPNAIKNIRLEDYTVVWDQYDVETSNSYQYKIKDEFVTIDELGNETVNVNIYTANIGDESYTPYITGKHKIAVAVVNLTSNLISNYVELDTEVDFNIFESGDGTYLNPYIISTTEQFNNMKFRLSKDPKLNSYYAGKIVDGKLEIDEVEDKIELADKDLIFNFKQIVNLTVSRKYMLNKAKVSENYTFNGNYDANYNSITLELLNSEGLENYEKSYISLFDKIGNVGIVCNLNLLLKLEGALSKTISTISALCYENAGTISNIAIGEIKENKELLQMTGLTKHIGFSFIAYDNKGIIKMVQNYYDVKFTTNESNSYAIQFATIALINNKEISQCKNLGMIEISAAIINVSGIAGTLSTGATLNECANAGNLKLYYNRRGEMASYIGGLVSQNTYGIIKSCYSVCDITVSYNMSIFNNQLPDAYIGGIIGYSTGDNVTDSYTNVTKNMNTASGLDNIYQVIGLLQSATSGTKVYYKNGDIAAYSGTNNISEGEYIAYDTMDISYLSDKFSLTILEENNNNPHLIWEDLFNSLVWTNMGL